MSNSKGRKKRRELKLKKRKRFKLKNNYSDQKLKKKNNCLKKK